MAGTEHPPAACQRGRRALASGMESRMRAMENGIMWYVGIVFGTLVVPVNANSM